ncbi:MAG: hypothetical protein OEX11_04400 [Nitrosomonas sp.]|nr:hypothetical protein [Nitrosomonas sp.]
MDKTRKLTTKNTPHELVSIAPTTGLDYAFLDPGKIGGKVLSIKPFMTNMVTFLEGEYPIFLDEDIKYQKANACCEGQPIKPRCRIVSISLTKDFSNLKVRIWGKHVCGIQSIAAFIAKVKYEPLQQQPGGPQVILRKLTPVSINGQILGDFKRYSCPSNIKTRVYVATLPTNAIVGDVFTIRTAVKSCCNKSDVHGLDNPCLGDSGDQLII